MSAASSLATLAVLFIAGYFLVQSGFVAVTTTTICASPQYTITIPIPVICTTTTITNPSYTTTSIACPSTPCPFYNPNSQKVADLFVQQAWDSSVQMMHDVNEPGCNDYVGGLPCDNTFWTTSDNVPTCWTLGDYGYSSIMQQCESKVISLGAFTTPRDGQRYEAYVASLIVPGDSCCIHTILQPTGADIQCPQTGCFGHSYGSNSNGLYNIQSDAGNSNGPHTPNPNAGVDTAGPQAINEWLLGNKAEGLAIANNLVSTMVNSGWIGTGSTWQLGQVLFVMRVYGMDSSNPGAFNAGVQKLWSLQNSQGYLPNTYSIFGPGSDHDPENMDAGLLPFSYSTVTLVQNSFGKYSSSPWAAY